MGRLLLLFVIAIVLSGCDKVREQLHMLPNQDEQECLNSERLNFKDPDVLFVANLGDRGTKLRQNQYWVRYKAKNSYGAYIQGNMLCEKNPQQKWVQAKTDQLLQLMTVQNALMRDVNERMKAGESELFEKFRYIKFEDWAYEQAEKIVLTSADSLARYQDDSSTASGKPQ